MENGGGGGGSGGGGGFGFGTGGGGFSFPVTPPSGEPDQSKLFTSWPSVRSSCTSELHANSDDDTALMADYQDEGG